MNKKFSVKMAITGTLAMAMSPFIALAQDANVTSFVKIIGFIHAFINTVMPIIISLAVLYFVWNVFLFVGAGDDEEKRKAARGKMIFGIIAIFVMVSVWGLVNILVNTFGLSNVTVSAPDIPAVVPFTP